jgi:hypothetical protein
VIDGPRYSRPIDVHRWSDHPEVKALVEKIWEGYLPEEITGKPGEKRTGPKPKTSFKKMLRVLILDLYVAWQEDPECANSRRSVASCRIQWQAVSRPQLR